MKYTKNAENKKKGDKITFRVNVLEDKKLIEYIDKAKNGSGFIKEAIKFYIMAIEQGLVSSYYLENTEKEWDNILKNMNNEPKNEDLIENPVINEPKIEKTDEPLQETKNIFDDIDIDFNTGLVIGINEMDIPETHKKPKKIDIWSDREPILNLDWDAEFDDIDDYIDMQN